LIPNAPPRAAGIDNNLYIQIGLILLIAPSMIASIPSPRRHRLE
jgi:hypothetical protein